MERIKTITIEKGDQKTVLTFQIEKVQSAQKIMWLSVLLWVVIIVALIAIGIGMFNLASSKIINEGEFLKWSVSMLKQIFWILALGFVTTIILVSNRAKVQIATSHEITGLMENVLVHEELSKKIEDILKEVRDMSGKTKGLDKSIAELPNKIEDILKEVRDMSEKTKGLDKSIAELPNKIGEVLNKPEPPIP